MSFFGQVDDREALVAKVDAAVLVGSIAIWSPMDELAHHPRKEGLILPGKSADAAHYSAPRLTLA